MTRIFWIALAGAAGALSRYFLQGYLQRHATLFPWGTFAVNMLGCLLFGIVWALADAKGVISPAVRVVLLVGFMGAFTTFSSFAFDTYELAVDGRWLLAVTNVVAQNVLGLASLILGISIVRVL